MSYTLNTNLIVTKDALKYLRPENARKLPSPLAFVAPFPSLTGKAAVKALEGLTLEEKEQHKLNLSKQRNNRRQEKINILREIDSLPTNKEKLFYVLRLYNQSMREMPEDELMRQVDAFLETLWLE